LYCFVKFRRLVEVHHVNVAICSRYDQHCVFRVHAVDTVLAGDRSDGGRLSEIPVFYCLVPRAGDEDRSGLAWDVDEASTANGLIMRRDLLGGSLTGCEVYHAGCFIGARTYHFGAVLDYILVNESIR